MAEQRGAAARRVLAYTGLRLVVFLVTAAVLRLLGLNVFLALLVAVPASSVVSLFVLRSQRAAMITAAAERRERRSAERAALRARLDDD